MALSDILGSAVSGLAASQAGLRSVSNNIANVGTAGYARERVSLSTSVTAGRVSGVVVGEPQRIADRFLEGTVYRLSGDMGQAEARASHLNRLQSLLGAPGAEGGLPARLDAVFASAVRLTAGQPVAQGAAAFVGDIEQALAAMKQLDGDVAGLRADVESEVGYTVERVNGLLARIHELNDTVASLDGLGRSSAGVVGQRMTALEELSGLLKVTVRDQPDGRVAIESAGGAVLLDRRLRQLNYPTPGTGVSQPIYPAIEIRFADGPGRIGPATGERLDSAVAGGKLGGLLDLRDRALPVFSDQLGTLFGGLAETLNAVANEGTAFPAPSRLEGRATGLSAADRLGFTGTAAFAVAGPDGTLVARFDLDFDALGPGATVADAVAAINSGLAPHGSATFDNGRLTIAAAAPGQGIAVAQDAERPSARAGIGFAHHFGLNDLVRSADSPLVPSGFAASDPHGFGPGQTTELALRDGSGRALGRFTLTPPPGGTFADLVGQLNGGALGSFGSFALDARGRISFEPAPGVSGATLSITSDSTDRLGTGRSFSSLSGLTGQSAGLAGAGVRPDILADPSRLPLARLQTGAALGEKAIGPGDIRGANAFVTGLSKPVDLGRDGVQSLERFSSQLLGRAGLEAARAEEMRGDSAARRKDAANRRDNFGGVNIDEELAQMVVLQNSYSAAARVITTASQMYDTLIGMIR